jgi:hypothetical protein
MQLLTLKAFKLTLPVTMCTSGLKTKQNKTKQNKTKQTL